MLKVHLLLFILTCMESLADLVLCREEGNPNQTTELSNFEAGSWDGKQLPDPLKRCPAEQCDFERPTSQDCTVG